MVYIKKIQAIAYAFPEWWSTRHLVNSATRIVNPAAVNSAPGKFGTW